MAVRNRQNKMLILGVGLVSLAAAAVVSIRFASGPPSSQDAAPSPAPQDAGALRPSAGEAAADRPGETVQALAADQESLRSSIEGISDTVATGIGALTEQVGRLGKDLTDLRSEQENMADDDAADDRIDRLRAEMLAGMQAMRDELIADAGTDYPVAGGPDDRNRGVPGQDGFVWYSAASPEPVGGIPGADGGLASLGNLQPLGGAGILAAPEEDAPPPPVPAYTIPADATLVRSRGLTALIGRVPRNGEVVDPFPFKVITGRDNLLANGQVLPELERAVWSGTARGDATLHCVTGRVDQVTFIFRDGTISTRGGAGGNIGWISDEQGFPCIPGKFVSNLRENIAGFTAATAASGFARAWSEQQTTTIRDGATVTREITGDPGEYALGRGIAGGIDEWSRIAAERAREAFDAVVVPPGRTLTLNVSQAVSIDWPPEGRRVRHVSSLSAPGARQKPGGLD